MVFKLFNKEQIVILILTAPNKKNNPTEITLFQSVVCENFFVEWFVLRLNDLRKNKMYIIIPEGHAKLGKITR